MVRRWSAACEVSRALIAQALIIIETSSLAYTLGRLSRDSIEASGNVISRGIFPFFSDKPTTFNTFLAIAMIHRWIHW
jgi:hypothetical protein